MATPPLGWISPQDRTQEQNDAHANAVAMMPRFAMVPQTVPKGTKIILTSFLDEPAVINDMGGNRFTGFHQLTGSCVGCSAGNMVAVLSAVQRTVADNPQKAIIPWWGLAYGQTRRDEGDRGPGEGAVDSVMGQVLRKGVVDISHSGLNLSFNTDDGWYLTQSIEMRASDPRNIDPQLEQAATASPVGTVAPATSTEDIKTGIINGYPTLGGCAMYVGNGSVKGSGSNAYVAGHYDGNGGHSTGVVGYWEHPNDGPLFLYSNQWPTSTYPTDPAGGGRCTVWLTEVELSKLFRMGGNNGETMILSHLTTFPVQPKVLIDYSTI